MPDFNFDVQELRNDGSFGCMLLRYILENSEQPITDKKLKIIKSTGDNYLPYININKKRLLIGDYAYGNTVIEFKNEYLSNDFTISIDSGHLDKQMDKMFESTEYTHKYLIVFGNLNFDTYNYFRKLQAKGIHCVNVPIESDKHGNLLVEKGYHDLIYTILNTFFYCNKYEDKCSPCFIPQYNMVWTCLKSINGIGDVLGEKIIKHFYNVKFLPQLLKITVSQFKEVNGIGDKKANLIWSYLHGHDINESVGWDLYNG